MITVDSRVGSKELAPLLTALGLPVTMSTLSYADFAFLGLGDGGVPVTIGIERKTIPDFIQSMLTGRLPGHQIPGLLQCYQDIWILLEGTYRIGAKSGNIEVPRGHKTWEPIAIGTKFLDYQTFEAMQLTLALKAGVRIRHTAGQTESAKWLVALYHWWTAKDFESHRSHLRFSSVGADQALLYTPTLCRTVAAQLPGIGWTKSGPVEKQFGTVYRMVTADYQEWVGIPGVGKTLAATILAALAGVTTKKGKQG